VCGWVGIEYIDAYYLVIRTRGQVLVVARKPYCMDRARVVAQCSKLLGFREIHLIDFYAAGFFGYRVEYSICRPNSYVAVFR